MKRSPVAVVAAIIYDSRGKVLITKRPAHVHLGGLWEFPGGKVDPGENDEQALIREIREETGLAIRVKELYWREIAAFPEKTVRLHFYLCALTHEPQEIIPDEIDDYRWVSLNSLPAFRFPEADARLIDRLTLSAGQREGTK